MDDEAFTNVFVRDLAAGTTTFVSPGGTGADGRNPSVSGDGSRVAFESGHDIFVRDLGSGRIALVSRASGVAGPPGPADGAAPDISPSGRYVAFWSGADNLSSADDDSVSMNVFLRDLNLATTILVSRANGPRGAAADAISRAPSVSDNARVVFPSDARNLSSADTDQFGDVFVRDALAGTTELVGRAPGPDGPAADRGSYAVPGSSISADGRFALFTSEATNLIAGVAGGLYRRDLLGDAPLATPACALLPLPPPRPATRKAAFTVSARQLLIGQRIGQAAIRRLNAVEARLDGGLAARDLCGHSIGARELGRSVTSLPSPISLAPAAPADPAPIVDPGRAGPGEPVTPTARQLLINQRVNQAALRRAEGLERRLDGGLTGGDIRDGQVTQGKLVDRLTIAAAAPAPAAPASRTLIPPRRRPADPGSVTLSAGQLRINQRIAQAAVREANALVRRVETGLSGANLRPGTLTAGDLG